MTLRPASPTTWVLIAGFAVCAAINLPGHLSYDSIMQLNEGRRGFYANWHPPMMSWLLGVFDWILPGTALFTLFDLGLFFSSLGALLWLRPAPARASWLVLLVLLLTPQVVLYQGIVWKDVLFTNLAVAGFAALSVAGEKWNQPRIRWGAAALAFLLLCLATLVRQNGGVVLPLAVAAFALLAWKQTPVGRIRGALFAGAGALAASAVIVITIHSALALRIPGDPSPAVGFRLLEFYDLIGAIKREPSLPLPYLDDDDDTLEQLMQTDGVKLYTPQRNDTLAFSQRLQRAYFSSPAETIPEEWRHLVTSRPGLYLRVRSVVFRWIFLTPDLIACRPVFAGVDGPAAQMKKLGLVKRFDLRDGTLTFYGFLFVGTPIWSHPFFALLAILMLVVLFARRAPADIVMAFMLLSALAFTASFFVISIACDYRYLYFLDLATLVAAFHLSLDWRSGWRAVRRTFGGGT
ncbi:MAG TPA: hypothetical protein VKB71_13025 [Rhizomicrobium sp.]|nr:hypothetical protein [Rhizomicrobium sp.]